MKVETVVEVLTEGKEEIAEITQMKTMRYTSNSTEMREAHPQLCEGQKE